MFKINNDEIKVIITDMDGTLYSLDPNKKSEHKNHINNIRWLKQAIKDGVYVVMNTGNLPFFMKWAVNELTGDIQEFNKYFISCTGNLIHDFQSNKTWIENVFNHKIMLEIITIIKKFDLVYDITSQKGDVIYYSNEDFRDLMRSVQKTGDANYNHQILTDEILNSIHDTPKITMKRINLLQKPEIIKIIEQTFSKYNVKATWWSVDGVDLVIGETNKYNGILKLLDIINQDTKQTLKPKNVIYFGDSHNDISVFENLKYCIAVKDATPEVIAKAYDVSCDSHDGALGHYLAKIYHK
ncbi:HAD hydrolase family protein [Mesoplasma corruscae]|uniref:HAD superfamily hydrolase n=1 Tax=Mesoplasma corruscae TaxID=216874 RepID=A0A2S5REL1_9MOLU|nr:HAD family hydrolase [Mesoplasma corruscae]PPE05652.1 hypothetical protein MCORR_v1c06790 [Mesoplasma corruscae]